MDELLLRSEMLLGQAAMERLQRCHVAVFGLGGVGSYAAEVLVRSGVGMGAQFAMVSPILAIDPIIDMPRTMLNVTGSLTNAIVVDKHMGSLDEKAYNDKATVHTT